MEKIPVLLIEDNEGDIDLIKEYISRIDEFHTQLNVADTLNKAIKVMSDKKLEVILLDLSLPDSNGMASIEALRKQSDTETIIVLTSLNDRDVALKALDLGAQEYIFKGDLSADVLAKVIRYSIQRNKYLNEIKTKDKEIKLIVDCVDVGVWDWHIQDGYEYNSPRLWKMFGYDPEISKGGYSNWRSLLLNDDSMAFKRSYEQHFLSKGKYPIYQELQCRHRDGNIVWISCRGKVVDWDKDANPVRMIGTCSDITEFKSNQVKLAQTQKLDSIGSLAGGIAHDFNNKLHSMLLSVNIAKEKLKKGLSIDEELDRILSSIEQSSDLTRQILTFSKQQISSPKVINLKKSVVASQKTLQRMIDSNIEFKVQLEDIGFIKIDPTQLDQVIWNLCINSRDAMPSGGKLELLVRKLDIAGRDDFYNDITPGQYALLRVADTGGGISQKDIEKIFEPFFTTKEAGKGTGLGLATVYGIVKKSNGFIYVFSEVGRGTRIDILWPLVERKEEVQLKNKNEEAENMLTEGLKVLLIEDEDDVRYVLEYTLEELGCLVTSACNGEEALDIFKKNRDYDLIVTDVIMPKLGGSILVEHLEKLNPNLVVLYASGYTADKIESKQMDGKSGRYFIQKPFSSEELKQKIKEIMLLHKK